MTLSMCNKDITNFPYDKAVNTFEEIKDRRNKYIKMLNIIIMLTV